MSFWLALARRFLNILPVTASQSFKIYLVGLQPERLAQEAARLLQACHTEEEAAVSLSWQSPQELDFLKKAFPPQQDASQVITAIHHLKNRHHLRNQRLARGFLDLSTPRKGWKGWWQKRADRKECALPIGVEFMEWLNASYRLGLLTVLHDALLKNASVGVATEIPLQDLPNPEHPLAQMVATADHATAQKLEHALKSPLHKVSPDFLIHNIAGYVIYRPQLGFAYYYSPSS